MSREDAEALRKRLYAPDASGEDIERYRTAAIEVQPPAAPRAPAVDDAEPEPSAPVPRRRRRLLVVAAVATVLVVLAGVGVAAVRIAQAQQPTDLRAATEIATNGTDREAFGENLALGNTAGIAAYLVTNPSPPSMRGGTRYFTIERDGTGAGAVDLSPVPADTVSGRATVLLVLGGDAVASWTAFRRSVDSAGEQQYVRQAVRGGPQRAGVLTATTFRYRSGDRPVRLVLDVPDGVRWGVAVVFSD